MVKAKRARAGKLEVHPVTPKRWKDLVELFGPRGACGGCWCMNWRVPRGEYERKKGDGNRRAMKRLIDSGRVPGILGYVDREPIAWCSIEPREQFPYFEKTRILKPVDARPVWSITCLFIDKEFRGKGVSVELLRAAVEHVRKKGGEIVEGYPVEPKKGHMPDAFAWTGIAAGYLKAGFVEVARPSETRPIMRYYLKKKRKYQ
jgi:GNAT superfamily N-acetyltransferase